MALTDNLLAYWKLDESSGDAADATGGGQTLTNLNTVAYASGLINNCADFGTANTNKQLSKTTSIGYNGGINPVSISGWLKVRTEPSSGVLYDLYSVHGGTNPDNTRCIIRYQDSSGTKQMSWVRQSSSFNNTGTYNVTLGTSNWYHAVITFNGSTILGYLDGVERANFASTGGSGGDPTSGFSIGSNIYDSTQQSGSEYVDEVGVWSRALTSSEVTDLYNGGAGLAYPLTVAGGAVLNKNFTLLGVGN
jgi:hypothetical protein